MGVPSPEYKPHSWTSLLIALADLERGEFYFERWYSSQGFLKHIIGDLTFYVKQSESESRIIARGK